MDTEFKEEEFKIATQDAFVWYALRVGPHYRNTDVDPRNCFYCGKKFVVDDKVTFGITEVQDDGFSAQLVHPDCNAS